MVEAQTPWLGDGLCTSGDHERELLAPFYHCLMPPGGGVFLSSHNKIHDAHSGYPVREAQNLIVAIKKNFLIFFFAFPLLSGKFGKQSLRSLAAITFFFGISVFLYQAKIPVLHLENWRQYCASLTLQSNSKQFQGLCSTRCFLLLLLARFVPADLSVRDIVWTSELRIKCS
jgi:hypothetical protein